MTAHLLDASKNFFNIPARVNYGGISSLLTN
jgi:hypothetical protein